MEASATLTVSLQVSFPLIFNDKMASAESNVTLKYRLKLLEALLTFVQTRFRFGQRFGQCHLRLAYEDLGLF